VIRKLGNWRTTVMVDRYTRFSDDTLRAAAGKVASIVGGGRKRAKRDRDGQVVSYCVIEGDSAHRSEAATLRKVGKVGASGRN